MFVNSDEIAKGLSPFNADSIAVAVEASRIMYKRIKELDSVLVRLSQWKLRWPPVQSQT